MRKGKAEGERGKRRQVIWVLPDVRARAPREHGFPGTSVVPDFLMIWNTGDVGGYMYHSEPVGTMWLPTCNPCTPSTSWYDDACCPSRNHPRHAQRSSTRRMGYIERGTRLWKGGGTAWCPYPATRYPHPMRSRDSVARRTAGRPRAAAATQSNAARGRRALHRRCGGGGRRQTGCCCVVCDPRHGTPSGRASRCG